MRLSSVFMCLAVILLVLAFMLSAMHIHYGDVNLDSEEPENSQIISEGTPQYIEDVDIMDEGFGPSPQAPSGTSLAVQVMVAYGSPKREQPLAGALVQLSTGQSKLTDENGWAVFENVPAGKLTVRVETGTYGSVTATIEVDAGYNEYCFVFKSESKWLPISLLPLADNISIENALLTFAVLSFLLAFILRIHEDGKKTRSK